jgi:hypothetical protein
MSRSTLRQVVDKSSHTTPSFTCPPPRRRAPAAGAVSFSLCRGRSSIWTRPRPRWSGRWRRPRTGCASSRPRKVRRAHHLVAGERRGRSARAWRRPGSLGFAAIRERDFEPSIFKSSSTQHPRALGPELPQLQIQESGS